MGNSTGPKLKNRGAQWGAGALGAKATGPNSKTRWRRWAKTKKQNGIVGPKIENKMAPGFLLGEVGMVACFRIWK